MSGRIRAIGTGLLVGATSVTVAGAAAAAAGIARHHPAGAPTRARTTVAATRAAAVTAPATPPAVEAGLRARNDQIVVKRYTEALNLRRFFEMAAANAERERFAAAAAAAARSRRGPSKSSGSSGGVLDCIKHRESRGQYGAVNGSSGAAGAYQFMPGTWNTTARSAGRSDLVGVNPASASAADQDAMARQLLATQGLGPWGGGCG